MASTSPFTGIYAFGDSLSDAGNNSLLTSLFGAEPVSPPYYSASYGGTKAATFSNGPTWVQDLSVSLGLGTLAPSNAGGNDFAYGGAETGSTPQNSGNVQTAVLSLPAQLTQFETFGGKVSASTLFTMSVGGNDIFDILANPGLTGVQAQADVTAAVKNELSELHQLAKDGMRNLLVFNVPNLGVVPQVTFGDANGSNKPSASADALATTLSSSYNTQLATGLATQEASDGVSYHIVDVYGLITDAYNNPAKYGFTNVTTPVWTGNFVDAKSGTVSSTSPAVQDQNLFWDHVHPTASAHAIISNIAQSEVAPSYVYQQDLTTGQSTVQTAAPYEGLDTALQSSFASITPGSVALFASTPGTFLQSGAGSDILVAQSGTNVLSPGGGSNFIVDGTGSDTIYIDATGANATWNAVLNFHAGDMLSVVGYRPGVSAVLWTVGPSNSATLNVLTGGAGTSVWASDTFLGVSLATAQKFAVSTSGSGNLGVYTLSA